MRLETFIRFSAFGICALAIGSCATKPEIFPASVIPLLSDKEKISLQSWFVQHPGYRLPTEAECNCAEDIQQMRTSGSWGEPFPDYEPFVLRADFNKDGQGDFAVLAIRQQPNEVALLIFNGPFGKTPRHPAYVQRLDWTEVTDIGLFLSYGNHWPLVGRFESEGCVYDPKADTYREDCDDL